LFHVLQTNVAFRSAKVAIKHSFAERKTTMPSAIAVAMFLLHFHASNIMFAQQWQSTTPTDVSSPTAISSEAFMKGLPPGVLDAAPETMPFPNLPTTKAPSTSDLQPVVSLATYSTSDAVTQPAATETAQYQSPPPSIGMAPPIGSGVAGANSAVVQEAEFPKSPIPQTQPARNAMRWRDRLSLDTVHPNFLVGYEAIRFHRSNDSVGPYSQNDPLQRFDTELSGRTTVSRLFGDLERIDFIFTGPFHFEKRNSVSGPVDSNLPASISPAFNAADRHNQSHHIQLSSYELNFSSGDELSKFSYGLRIVDHNELFAFDSTKATSDSHFRVETENFMAGGQMGVDLFRPVSQRLSVGIGFMGGVFGNFASASVGASNGATSLMDAGASGFRINSMFSGNGRLKYQVTKNITASGGYEVWYFPGLATAADQRLASDPLLTPFSLQTDDDQFFRGWSAGLSGRF
jgi:hypothetical protein